MTTKIVLIIAAVCLIVGLGAGIGITYSYFHGHPIIVIQWKTKVGPTIYVKSPQTDCEKSAIWIEGKQDDNKFNVDAGDACKHASRQMEVVVRFPDKHWIIMPMITGAVAYDNILKKLSTGWGAQIPVGYKWGPAGLAVAPGFIKFPSRYEITGSVGGVFNF